MFCSRYLHGIETKFNQSKRNFEGSDVDSSQGLSVFSHSGYPLTKDKSRSLEDHERIQAHTYVLKNCEEVQPFLQYDFFLTLIIFFSFNVFYLQFYFFICLKKNL